MKSAIRDLLTTLPLLGDCWIGYRASRLMRDYLRRGERYRLEAERSSLEYSAERTARAVRSRIAARGYAPPTRRIGEVHTFAFIPKIGWHDALIPDLLELGPVTRFDYAELGVTPAKLWLRNSSARALRAGMNEAAFAALKRAHAQCAVDWVFVYASGLEIEKEFIERIGAELGIPTVNLCLDDRQSWEGPVFGDQRCGQIDLARYFDLSWTSARVACEWYLVEGGRPLFMPEGFDSHLYRPLDLTQDIDVSFIGNRYGFRAAFIRDAERAGVPIRGFGDGWAERAPFGPAQVEIINRSKVCIGHGGIGYSDELLNLKTRDFEVPGCGGGVYITTSNPELERFYTPGVEIETYSSIDELASKYRALLGDPDRRRELSARARARSLREHRWIHRYIEVLKTAGIVSEDTTILEQPVREAR